MGLVESGSYEVMSAWLNTPFDGPWAGRQIVGKTVPESASVFAESRRLKTFSSIAEFYQRYENWLNEH
jgi:hypothetical protein